MNNEKITEAFTTLYIKLNENGYSKYANELIAAVTSAPDPSQKARTELNILNKELEDQEKRKQAPIFKDQPGGVAPIIELSKIFDKVQNASGFDNLPINVQKGINKINKMTENAFRFASEKEAIFGIGRDPDSLKELKKLLINFDKTDPNPRKVPGEITQAVDNLNMLVDKALESRPKEKTLGEKGRDIAQKLKEKGQELARGVGEKARGIGEKGQELARGIGEKGQDIAQGIKEKGQDIARGINERREQQQALRNQSNERQQQALTTLKDTLNKHPNYRKIYYRLPPQIINILEEIGLGVDDLSNAATAKVACHINNTLLNYFRTKKAYSSKELSKGKKEEKKVYKAVSKKIQKKKKDNPSDIATLVAKERLKKDPEYYSKLKEKAKEGMDFSSISQMITPDKKLDERELARVIRLSISAEHDAVHLYELIADSSDDDSIKKVFQDVANEEKVHVSEFSELLSKFDKEDKKFMEEGKKEVSELID